MKTPLKIALASLVLALTPAANAALSVNLGALTVNPDNSGSALDQNSALGLKGNSNTQLGISLDYALNKNWALELIAATPFSHNVQGTGGLAGNNIATIKHLPPTLLAQYHFFDNDSSFRPFVGLGINYTVFFDEQPTEALKTVLGTDDVSVKLDNSFGFAAQLGANYKFNSHWAVHAMVAMMDIDTDANVYANGAQALTANVELDPITSMLAVRYSF